MNSQSAANVLLSLLVQDRNFQGYWIEETAEATSVMKKMENSLVYFKKPSFADKPIIKTKTDVELESVAEACENAVKFYLSNVHSYKQKIEQNSYDPNISTLFELSVQLDRLLSCKQFKPEQWAFSGQRIRRALRRFCLKVSNAYNIPSTLSFATTLCELIYKYEQYILLHEHGAETRKLRNSADKFYKNVVEKLKEANYLYNPRRSILRRSGFSLYYDKTAKQPKGFLLAPELDQMAKSRRLRKNYFSKINENTRWMYKKATATQQNNLTNSTNNDPTDRTALRIAIQVARDVISEVNRQF